jgi:propanol-preferring alcohol dehydrogenase
LPHLENPGISLNCIPVYQYPSIKEQMKAWMIHKTSEIRENQDVLQLADIPVPDPGPGEVLIKVNVCGVCHTEMDEIEGRTPPATYPMIPGHQVVGRIEKNGAGSCLFNPGDRTGVGWIFSACGNCEFCRNGRENLCREFKATGRDHHGGYAEFMIAREEYCFRIPPGIADIKAAPLFCAGAIGYRSLKLTGISNHQSLGLSGFGASAHLVLNTTQTLFPESPVYVFSRNEKERQFALELGADWAGNFDDVPPGLLDAIIDTTPAWKPVVRSLEYLKPGGRLVINAIRKENKDLDILTSLRYPDHLWLEKEIKSVANITRKDVTEFLHLAENARIIPQTEEYEFSAANKALADLKLGTIRGAKVISI